MRRLWLLLLLLASLPVLAAEGTPRPTVIVVDSSGSMAASLDGTVKLDAAREVLGELLGRWPADAPLALVAYGHRRTGDCADIEVLSPLGPPDPPAALKRLQDLRARGKTPLAASLQLAGTLLPAGSGGTVILVTDGLETCDADPCAVAAALAQAGAQVQVIGFGVTKQEADGLACIAEAGGGAYHTAADAGELLDSLGAAADAALAAEPAKPEEPPQPPGPQPVGLTAVYAGGERQLDEPARWQVVAQGGTPAFDYAGEGRGISLELPPGAYRVTVSAANAETVQDFTVGDGPATVTVPLAVGHLAATVATAKGQAPLADRDGPRWSLEPLDGQGAVALPGDAQPSLLLAAGHYRLAVTVGDWSAVRDVGISSGKTTEARLSLGLGGLTLEAALDEQGDAIAEWRGFTWRVLAPGGALLAERDREASPHLLLPAGDYRIELLVAGGSISGTASVAEGEERRLRLQVPSAHLTLIAALAPGAEPFDDWRDSTWTVTAIEALGAASGSSVLELQPALNPEVDLLPGRWQVTVQSGLASATREVTALPGASGSERLDLNAARLTIVAAPGDGQEAPVNVVFTVAPLTDGGAPGEETGLGGSSGTMATVLPAGRWRVVAGDERGRAATADVTLRPGDGIRLELQLE